MTILDYRKDTIMNSRTVVRDPRLGTKYDPEVGSVPWLWCLLFGPFYLAYKGLWGHAILWFIMCWTLVFPWLVYPMIARNIVYHKMVKDGLVIKRQ